MKRAIEQDLSEKQRTALLAVLKGMPQDEHLLIGIPLDSLLVGFSDDLDHLGVDHVVFIDQATTPDAVSAVGTA